MKTNWAGRDLILYYEKFFTKAYPDPASALARELRKPVGQRAKGWENLSGAPWTIGIGATGPDIGPETIWTADQVWERYEKDLIRHEKIVEEAVTVPLTENQFSALVSFVFNVGPGEPGKKDGFVWLRSGRHSTLLTKLNAGDYQGAAEEIPHWARAQGQVLEGLRRRREEEKMLFLLS